MVQRGLQRGCVLRLGARWMCVCALLISSALQASDLEWLRLDETSIPIPPQEHPRLYLRSSDLPDLRRRMEHPVLEPARKELAELAHSNAQFRVEWEALQYLLDGNDARARNTVTAALDTMRQASWDMERSDISRAIGRLMVTGAIVYDWCYVVLTPQQKSAFRDEFVRMGEMLESGYPPRGGTITGHASEQMIMRDMMSAGIAMYDEYPEMYWLAAGRVFRYHVPARNWFYPGHAYHQGDSYNGTRFWADMVTSFLFKRLGAGDIYHPAQQFVGYQMLYMRRPDGQYLRNGDTFLSTTSPGRPWSSRQAGWLSASYYRDGYLQEDFLLTPNISAFDRIFELLWRDPDLQPRSVTELPNTRYMGFPFGWMIARTGWDADCVMADMKVNVYNFVNHQHLDGGSFQIYHKGALAIDSGVYEGATGGYGSAHDANYNKRTIAHNSLLVFDPNEQFPQRRSTPILNDGGQRMPNNWSEPGNLEYLLSRGYNTGEVLGHGFGPDAHVPAYTYLKGDITGAYSDKVEQVHRSFVFLNLQRKDVPAALIVFDRVVSRNPSFKKTWLLHSMEEPTITVGEVVITKTTRGDHGRLVNTVLLPEMSNAVLEKIGGPGKEFWVAGQNFPNGPRPGREGTMEAGAWRVELSPKTPAGEDLFLNALQVMDASQTQSLPVQRIDEETCVGVRIADRAVLFQRTGERTDRPLRFTVDSAEPLHILVTDLAAGTWQVYRNGNLLLPAVPVSDEAGLLYLEASGGEFELRR